jgi:hypothetical protein
MGGRRQAKLARSAGASPAQVNPVSQKASASCRWPAPALAMWQIEHTSELF